MPHATTVSLRVAVCCRCDHTHERPAANPSHTGHRQLESAFEVPVICILCIPRPLLTASVDHSAELRVLLALSALYRVGNGATTHSFHQ